MLIICIIKNNIFVISNQIGNEEIFEFLTLTNQNYKYNFIYCSYEK